MKFMKTLSLSLLFTLAVCVTAGFAQTTETVTASGTVVASIQVSGTAMAFGDLLPDVENTATSQFDINGEAGKDIQAVFTLPGTLTDALDNTISISFTGESSQTSGGTKATEADLENISGTLEATDGTFFIWLEGSTTPPMGQATGEYSADIDLEVSYVGN